MTIGAPLRPAPLGLPVLKAASSREEPPSREDLFHPQKPREPEPLSLWIRTGPWVTGVSTAAAAGVMGWNAAHAAGGVLGRLQGLGVGAVFGGTVGFVLGGTLVHALSFGKASEKAVMAGSLAGVAAGLVGGWLLGGTALPESMVLGPTVFGAFFGLLGGTVWSGALYFDEKQIAHDKAVLDYRRDLEEYERGRDSRPPEAGEISEADEYIDVNGVKVPRRG